MRSRTCVLICVAGGISAGGCATPQRIKDASTTQLQLIDALDAAAKSLNAGLLDYAAADDELIHRETRILVARQAIYAALAESDAKPKTFDQAFIDSNAKIRPFVDITLADPKELELQEQALTGEIAKLDSQLAAMHDGVAKTAISIQRDKLHRRQATLATRPADVTAQLDAGASAMRNVDKLRALVNDDLAVLRARIALMKTYATHVDSWLKIDVTPTQDQVNGLTNTFSDLIKLGQETTK